MLPGGLSERVEVKMKERSSATGDLGAAAAVGLERRSSNGLLKLVRPTPAVDGLDVRVEVTLFRKVLLALGAMVLLLPRRGRT